MAQTLEQRAAAVFEAMLAVPPADRLAAAAVACGDDAPLLVRVRELIEALAGADAGFLADATAATVDHGPADSTPNGTPGGMVDGTVDGPGRGSATTARIGEAVGDRIGPYRLLEQIGEGGFGVVFKAEQERPVRRLVALKVIKLGMDTREVVARFEAERQALALMDHPNIARVFDAGSTAAGRPYFVMELVDGCPITEYCDRHRMGTAERVALLGQVCRAVQHAHAKAVIHRDLKPSNVLVGSDDHGRPVPKVIDFGIAKAARGLLGDRTRLTAFRQLVGTPQYMSPEQADGDGDDVDTRSDVYSLGVVLYELLVGATPLDARRLRSAAVEAMRRMIREVDPPRLSSRLSGLGETATTVATARGTDPKRLGQQLHGELDWIVMRALEKDRGRRYDTAAAMADDLGRYLADEAVLARPAGGAYRLRKLARRHRAAVAVTVALAAALLVGAVGTTVGLVRAAAALRVADARRVEAERATAAAESARLRAEAGERRAETAQQSSEAVTGFLVDDVLGRATTDQVPDPVVRDTLIKAIIDPATAGLARRFGGQPLVRAAVQSTLAEVMQQLGRRADAVALAGAAYDTRRAVLGDGDPLTRRSMAQVVITRIGDPHSDEAIAIARRLWDQCRQADGDEAPATLKYMGLYGLAIHYQEREREAEAILRAAVERSRRRLGDGDPITIDNLNYLARTLRLDGRPREAEEPGRLAWEGVRRQLGPSPRHEAISIQVDYMAILRALDKLPEAAELARQSWEQERLLLGDANPRTRYYWRELVGLDQRLGRAGELADRVRQLLPSVRDAQPPRPDDHVELLLELGQACLAGGQAAEAERLTGEALAMYRGLHPRPDNGLSRYLVLAGDACLAAGHPSAAEPLCRERLRQVRQRRPVQPALIADALVALNAALAREPGLHVAEVMANVREAVTLRAAATTRPPTTAPTTGPTTAPATALTIVPTSRPTVSRPGGP